MDAILLLIEYVNEQQEAVSGNGDAKRNEMYGKACPRCRGDVFTVPQVDGPPELQCLQCGWSVSPEQVRKSREQRAQAA